MVLINSLIACIFLFMAGCKFSSFGPTENPKILLVATLQALTGIYFIVAAVGVVSLLGD